MICRFLDKQDITQVEKIWESCFEKRNEPFFQFFFTDLYPKIYRGMGGFNAAGELVTMIFYCSCSLRIHGETLDVPYLGGVATAEKFRGHHYMGELMNFCCETIRQENYPFVMLMPVAEQIYTPYGFVGVDYHIQPKFAEIEKNFTLVPCGLDGENFQSLYDAYMQKRSGVVRSQLEWDNFLLVARSEDNQGYLLEKNGIKCGYLITDKKQEVVEVISPLPLPQGNKPFIMAKGLQGQVCKSYFGNDLYINKYF